MRKQVILAASLSLAFAAAACSSGGSSSTSTSTGSGGGTTSSTTTTATSSTGSGPPATSCTMPGDKGNDIGVGEYCTPGGGECSAFADTVCLADVGQDQWFCTLLGCSKDADCGMAAHCHMDPAGAACVPDKCEPSGTGGSGGAGGSM